MKTTFNRDFYATITTVIPVLYLALTVQGPLYSSMLKRAWSGLLRKERDLELSLRLLRVSISVGLIIAAVVILAAGLGGEILAIFALYNGSSAQAGPWVLLSVIALVVATAVGPFWAFLRLPCSTCSWGHPPTGSETAMAAAPGRHLATITPTLDDGTASTIVTRVTPAPKNDPAGSTQTAEVRRWLRRAGNNSDSLAEDSRRHLPPG